MKLKDNRGFTGADVAISTIILIVFMSLISTLFYNITVTSTKIQRKSVATELAIKTIESLKTAEFANLTVQEIPDISNTAEDISVLNLSGITVPNGYTVGISIANPEGDEEIGQTVKKITVDVIYRKNKTANDTITLETLVKN